MQWMWVALTVWSMLSSCRMDAAGAWAHSGSRPVQAVGAGRRLLSLGCSETLTIDLTDASGCRLGCTVMAWTFSRNCLRGPKKPKEGRGQSQVMLCSMRPLFLLGIPTCIHLACMHQMQPKTLLGIVQVVVAGPTFQVLWSCAHLPSACERAGDVVREEESAAAFEASIPRQSN